MVRAAHDERTEWDRVPPDGHDLAVFEHRGPSVRDPFVLLGERRAVPAERPSFRLRARFGIHRRIRLALFRGVPPGAALGASGSDLDPRTVPSSLARPLGTRHAV